MSIRAKLPDLPPAWRGARPRQGRALRAALCAVLDRACTPRPPVFARPGRRNVAGRTKELARQEKGGSPFQTTSQATETGRQTIFLPWLLLSPPDFQKHALRPSKRLSGASPLSASKPIISRQVSRGVRGRAAPGSADPKASLPGRRLSFPDSAIPRRPEATEQDRETGVPNKVRAHLYTRAASVVASRP